MVFSDKHTQLNSKVTYSMKDNLLFISSNGILEKLDKIFHNYTNTVKYLQAIECHCKTRKHGRGDKRWKKITKQLRTPGDKNIHMK